MNQEIEAKINQLKKEAEGLYKYAKILARKRGGRYPKKHGANWFYNDGWLRIRWDDYHPNLSVHAYEEWVMNFTSGKCNRFRRGNWIKHLIEKAAPLLAVEQADKEKLERMKEYQRLENWGLENEVTQL